MTSKEYLTVLEKLNLAPFSVATAEALGVSVSQLARLASGGSPVTPMLERLLKMYVRFGVPRGI